MYLLKYWKVVFASIAMFLAFTIGLAISLLPAQAALLPINRLPAQAAIQRSDIVNLTYAQYQGVSLHNGVDQFIGMRYASPPLGELRWRAPQDPPSRDNVVDALSFGPLCPGVSQTIKDTIDEDCLFVNVWRPSNASVDAKLPVWVFIQGGGYANLANANFNGSDVVHHSGNDIILVNFNYRVGALGFLASEDIRKNGDLNVGLLDQRQLLSWVQQHIGSFGGDPDHVVIHGDSAGAGSVAYHMAAYGGTDLDLFVGAVAESSFWPTTRTVAEMEFQFQDFASKVGCGSAQDTLSCLRSTDIATIQKHNRDAPFPGAGDGPTPLWYFLPVIDGGLITERLYSSFQNGKFIRVPVIVTDDNNEGTDFGYNAKSASEVSQFLKSNYPGLNDDQLETINNAYPHVKELPNHAPYFPLASAAYGESTFTCPGNYIAASVSKFFLSDHVWNYRCNIHDPTEISKGKGVPHVFELPAIFGLGSTNQPADSLATSNAPIVPIIMNYYISFIKSLNPNKFKDDTAPIWRPWGNGTGERIRIQTNATAMEAVPSAQAERCSMWRGFAMDMEQ